MLSTFVAILTPVVKDGDSLIWKEDVLIGGAGARLEKSACLSLAALLSVSLSGVLPKVALPKVPPPIPESESVPVPPYAPAPDVDRLT